jgi:cytoskeletal protein CcmA (bactofilin family)
MKRRGIGTGVLLGTVVLALLLTSGSVQAFEERSGQTIIIQAGEVINDDLVVAAETFVLNGTVKGDVMAVGGSMTIGPTGVVEGDLMAAGREVVVDGAVKDDARIAGASLKVGGSGQIGDDLMAAGYSLETEPGSKIGGTLVFAGGQAVLGGEVAEKANVAAEGVSLLGKVGGDVKAVVGSQQDELPFSPFDFMPDMPRVPRVPAGLTIGPNASIGGSLDYTGAQETSIPPGVVEGEVTYTQPAPKVQEQRQPLTPRPGEVALPSFGVLFVAWLLGLVRNTATLLIVGLLLAWLAPGLARRGSEVLKEKPWPCLGWGAIAFFGVWVAAMVIVFVAGGLAAFLTILTLFKLAALVMAVGLLLASILIVAYVIAAGLLAKIIVGYLIGRLILRGLDPTTGAGRVWPLVLGLVILAIVASIPCLGWVANLIVVLVGLGAQWLLVAQWWKGRRTGTASMAAPGPGSLPDSLE